MHKFLFLLISFAINAQTEIIDAKKSILLIIQQTKRNSSSKDKFRLDKCEKINWEDILNITKKTELHFDFKEGCDIKGGVSPKLLNWFPIDLELRNIPNYNRIKASGLISAILEQKPIIKLDIKEGTLSNEKSNLEFEGNYKVGPDISGDKTLPQRLGGEVIITNLNGKKLAKPEKILIK